jgi:hypothetical protein
MMFSLFLVSGYEQQESHNLISQRAFNKNNRENKELREGLKIACGTIVHPSVHSDYLLSSPLVRCQRGRVVRLQGRV